LIEKEEDIEAEEKREKRAKKSSRAYQEPAKVKKEKPSTPVSKVKSKEVTTSALSPGHFSSLSIKKCVRDSTKKRTEETQKRIKQASQEKRGKKSSSNRNNCRQLTQEELLKEAKITEKINLKSLEKYQQLELEKAKKNKIVKEAIKGPIIRYLSSSMPLIESDGRTFSDKRCSRNFISFTDKETFNFYFKKNTKPPQIPNPPICLISNLKARYFDPVTQMPFASSHTFKILREAYCQQLEHLGDTRQPEVAAWIEWRKKQNT